MWIKKNFYFMQNRNLTKEKLKKVIKRMCGKGFSRT